MIPIPVDRILKSVLEKLSPVREACNENTDANVPIWLED